MFNKIFLIHDKEEENKTKEALMTKSGIPYEYVKFHNINFKDDINDYVHLMLIDDKSVENKKDLIFIHGLSVTSVLYFGLFQEIRHKFRIFALDIPGMGCSSRNDVDFNNFNDAQTYFLDRIKNVLDTFGLLKDLTFVGHSLGGYISGLFSIKYPERVKNLILLSPVGISSIYYKYYFENCALTMLMKRLYEIKFPPTSSYKIMSIFADLVLPMNIDMLFKDTWLKNDEEMWNLFREMISIIYKNYCLSEKALYHFFDCDLRAFKTLTQNYKSIENINILFFYGDNDWNPVEAAFDELIPCVEIEIIEDSTHQLYSDKNYKNICQKIMDFVCKRE